MKVPLSWLREYVPINLSPKELAHRLTMSGVEVGGVEVIGGWNDVFVGLVTKVERHPNADRLTLTTVNLGNATHTVVCGAPNVAAGQKIAFAKEGAILFNTHSGKVEKLKAAKIRGVLSAGMVCSELELGLGKNHEGILVLDENAPLGVPLSNYLGDVILDMEPTSNRGDCFSVLGVAHEVAAITDVKVTGPEPGYPEDGTPIEEAIRVEIADPDLCARYTASLIRGVKIGPSPRWLQERLEKAGQRPINNVVDITNYVMLEYGQPLHSFDYTALKDRTIIIRRARPGEKVTTLDGVERKLEPPILTIANSKDAIALAGVMGGASSEITDATTDIFLESANFDAINTRRTSTVLKLRTEASSRFEKGLRPELAILGLRRATQLIQQIAGGKVSKGIIDVYPTRKDEQPIQITQRRLRQVLGTEMDIKHVEKILLSLGFTVAAKTHEALSVKPPYWRSDITIEDDLVEEVARITGYDQIPMTTLSTKVPAYTPQPMTELKERIRDTLAAAGMQEAISYSLTSLDILKKANAIAVNSDALRIANPLSGDLEYLRISLRGSILKTLASNIRIEDDGIRLFEIGRVYMPGKGDLPEERETAIGVFAGSRYPTSWLTKEVAMDFFDAKGVVESLLARLGIKPAFEKASDSLLHPGKSVNVLCSGTFVGVIGEVHPGILERFDIKDTSVAMFELDLESLNKVVAPSSKKFQPFSRFPHATRDIAVLLDENVPSEQVRGLIAQNSLVSDVALFDVYTGEGVTMGKKSLAYRIQFLSPSATLTSEQVNKAMEIILSTLQKQLGAELRA